MTVIAQERSDRSGVLLGGLALFLLLLVTYQDLNGATLWVDPHCENDTEVADDLVYCVSVFPCLTDALATTRDGDVIVLNPGRYDTTIEKFPIVVDKAVTIRSAGGSKETVVVGPPATDVFEILAHGTEISGLTIEHTRSGLVVSADDVSVIGNRILLSAPDHRTSSCGVWLAGARRARIIGNEFVGCGVCLAGPRASESTGKRIVLTGLFEVGEDPRWFATHNIQDNMVNGRPLVYAVDLRNSELPEDAGQILIASCADLTVRGAQIAGASVGIQIAHSTGVDILQCELRDNGLFGLYLAYSSGCRVSDLVCVANNHGVDIRASRGNEVRDAFVQANEQGIFLAGGLANLTATSTVTENGIGMYLGDSGWNTILDNEITDNHLGIYARGAEGTWIVGNHLAGNEQSGIRLSKASDCSVIERNVVAGNQTGILVLDSAHASVRGNKIAKSEITGLYVSGATLASVLCNLFLENGVDIRIEKGTRDTILHTNAFPGNGPAIRNEGTEIVDARDNWWGTTDGSSVARRLDGPVRFLPLLDVPLVSEDEIAGGR